MAQMPSVTAAQGFASNLEVKVMVLFILSRYGFDLCILNFFQDVL